MLRAGALGMSHNEALECYGYRSRTTYALARSKFEARGIAGLLPSERGRPPGPLASHEGCDTESRTAPHIHVVRRYGKDETLLYGCDLCGRTFCDRVGTALYGLQTPVRTVSQVLRALARGVGVRAASEIFEIAQRTVLNWLLRGGQHFRLIHEEFLVNLMLEQCQLDELWSFVAKKEKHVEPFEKLMGIYGDRWTALSFDPVSKIIPSRAHGRRNRTLIRENVAELKAVCHEDCWPLFTSDGLAHYPVVLLELYGIPRRSRNGKQRHPHPNLKYAQVVKRHRKGRLVEVERRVVYGDPTEIEAILQESLVTHCITTSGIERSNLTWRQWDPRLTRKTLGFSKKPDHHDAHFELVRGYYHLVHPHASLAARTAAGKTDEQTPFMAAGLTDHVWSMEEALCYKPRTMSSNSR